MMNSIDFILLFLLFGTRVVTAQEDIRFSEKGDTCNVIHVNCGSGQQLPDRRDEGARNPGAPGKIGPVGPTGPKGRKGEMGSQGRKGDKGEDANPEDIKRVILGMLGVTSCMQLHTEYGVNDTGYYLMRVNGTDRTAYRHCHFSQYEDIFTCHALRRARGISESGHYILGPKSNPYEVYCNFAPSTAVTEVWHDSMREVQIREVCEGAGCYSRIPQYETEGRNIFRIIENSINCRQYIKLRCAGVQLFRGNHAWWVSRENEKMLYWGGARTNGYCGCGETGTCVDPIYKCNCDNNSAFRITQDDGFLRDKSKLPVRELRFGDIGDADEMAWHELGALQCYG